MGFELFKKKNDRNSGDNVDISLKFVNETVKKIQSETEPTNSKLTLEIKKPKKKKSKYNNKGNYEANRNETYETAII